MTEITLEQQVLLISGWLRKLEGIQGDIHNLKKEDLPPGYQLQSETFLKRQHQLVAEAVAVLETAIEELRRSRRDAAAIVAYQCSKVSDQDSEAASSKAEVGTTLVELSQKHARLKRELLKFDSLLQILRGETETARPNMPLYQYALAWERFRQADTQAVPQEPDTKATIHTPAKSRMFQKASKTYKALERTDRIALGSAVLICVFVAITGYLYIHAWGRLHMEIENEGDGLFKLTFANSFGETISLNAPHTGHNANTGPLQYFGVSAQVSPKDSGETTLDEMDAQWLYKDQPGHLYGPILISPLSAEEVYLQLSPKILKTGLDVIHIVVYRSSNRPYASKTVRIQ